MSTLNVTQLYALARKAGLPPARAVTAAAVAMAESSGRTAETSSNPDGGTNVGLWQLDTKGKGAGYSVAQLQDPATNAQVMAKGSSNGTDWSAWETYVTGAYQQFVGGAAAAQSSEQSGGGGWVDSILGTIGSAWKTVTKDAASTAAASVGGLLIPSQISGFFGQAEDLAKSAAWLFQPANWARIIAGYFGSLLLVAGLIVLVASAW